MHPSQNRISRRPLIHGTEPDQFSVDNTIKEIVPNNITTAVYDESTQQIVITDPIAQTIVDDDGIDIVIQSVPDADLGNMFIILVLGIQK